MKPINFCEKYTYTFYTYWRESLRLIPASLHDDVLVSAEIEDLVAGRAVRTVFMEITNKIEEKR